MNVERIELATSVSEVISSGFVQRLPLPMVLRELTQIYVDTGALG